MARAKLGGIGHDGDFHAVGELAGYVFAAVVDRAGQFAGQALTDQGPRSTRWTARRRTPCPCAAAQPSLACRRTCMSSASSTTGPSGKVRRNVPGVLQLGQQRAAVGLGQQLFHRRQPLAQPRAKPLQVGQDGVGDIVVGPLGELDFLHVQFAADQAQCVLQATARCVRSARMTSTLASGWRTLSLAAMRAERPSETISRTRLIWLERASSIRAAMAGRIVAKMDALDGRRCGRRDARTTKSGHGQILPQFLGQKRHKRRDQLGRGQEDTRRASNRRRACRRRGRLLQKRSRLRRTYQLLKASTNSINCAQALKLSYWSIRITTAAAVRFSSLRIQRSSSPRWCGGR